jgi:hypothetical protein
VAIAAVGGDLGEGHLRKIAPAGRRRGLTYAVTTLHRAQLGRGRWTIFFVDVAGFPRRVIRSRNSRLLRRLFAEGQTRISVYIPLDGRPKCPRYDFLKDEGRWD